jgi:uracil DNA glycosylase
MPKREVQRGGETVIEYDTGAPLYETKGNYLNQYFFERQKVMEVIIGQDGVSQPKLREAVLFAITHIPSREKQKELYKIMDSTVQELKEKFIKETGRQPDNERMSRIEREAAIKTMGELSEWMDQTMALLTHNIWQAATKTDLMRLRSLSQR